MMTVVSETKTAGEIFLGVTSKQTLKLDKIE